MSAERLEEILPRLCKYKKPINERLLFALFFLCVYMYMYIYVYVCKGLYMHVWGKL